MPLVGSANPRACVDCPYEGWKRRPRRTISVMSYVIWPPKSQLSWPSMGAGVWSLSKSVEALDEYFCPR